MSTNGGAGRGKRPAGVDAQESARWRSPNGAVNSVNPKKPPSLTRTDPCAVAEEDLKVLEQMHTLLRALNDAYAGGPRVGQLVAAVPVLAARIVRRARKRFSGKANCTLPEAMTLIGNIGLESEIMQLLEDLTILSSELTEKKTGQ
jgi:hypothetical protein